MAIGPMSLKNQRCSPAEPRNFTLVCRQDAWRRSCYREFTCCPFDNGADTVPRARHLTRDENQFRSKAADQQPQTATNFLCLHLKSLDTKLISFFGKPEQLLERDRGRLRPQAMVVAQSCAA